MEIGLSAGVHETLKLCGSGSSPGVPLSPGKFNIEIGVPERSVMVMA